MVRRRCPRFFLALDTSYVPPRSVVIAGIAIVPIEEYGDQIGRHIVPAISGVGEIVEAWPGAVVFCEYGLYPGEQASLWVADLGQPSMEGEVVDEVIQ